MRRSIPMRRWSAALVVALALAAAAQAGDVVPRPGLPAAWAPDLDDGSGPDLGFLFEVTFMKIDVAFVDAFLAPAEETALAAISAEGKRNDQRRDAAAAALLAADRLAFRYTLCRDGGLDKFRAGVRRNLEAARDAGLIDADGVATVWSDWNAAVDGLGGREPAAGDEIVYVVEPDGVRMGWFDVDGEQILDVRHDGAVWSRAIAGSFLAPRAKLREKLLRSLWERES